MLGMRRCEVAAGPQHKNANMVLRNSRIQRIVACHSGQVCLWIRDPLGSRAGRRWLFVSCRVSSVSSELSLTRETTIDFVL